MTQRAFTLIELVISTLILVVVVVSVYSAFCVGMKAWRRQKEGQDIQKIRISLMKIEKELLGSFYFSKAPFKGWSSGMEFPIILSEPDAERVYIVKYYIAEDRNKEAKALMKNEFLFPHDNEIEEKNTGALIFSAGSMVFNYGYVPRDGTKNIEWQDEWSGLQGSFPLAIKISFSPGSLTEVYNKAVFIPHGKLGEF